MTYRYQFGLLVWIASGLCLLYAGEQPGSGRIAGNVVNASTSDSLVGANITIVGSTLGTSSSVNGQFRIVSIPPGTYQVRASALGFSVVIQRDVVVRAGEETVLNFRLNEESIQVGEVIVSGTKDPEVAVMPLSTHYLEYKEIHNTAGAFDDVIRTVSVLPGMAQVKPDRNDLLVRGGAPSENLFMIDNIEVPNINHFGMQGNTGGSVSYINFEFIDNFHFSNGGFGVKYGDKLSSVLVLGIRQGRTDRHRAKVTLAATSAGLNLEGPIAEQGSYLFSARRSYLDPVFKLYGFSYIPYFYDVLAKATYRLDKSNALELLAVGAIDRININNDTPTNLYNNSRELFSNQNKYVAGLTWRHGFDAGNSQITLRHSYTDYDYLQFDKKAKPVFTNISYEEEWSLRGDGVYVLTENTELSIGADAKYINLDSRVYLTPIVTGFKEYPIKIVVDTANTAITTKGAIYLQLAQKIGDLTITAGIRAEYFELITHDLAYGPRCSFSYSFSPITKATVSGGEFYQAPSYIWLMTNTYNRGLKHLGMTQYVLSLEHYLESDIKVTVEGYYKKYFSYPASILREYLVMSNTGAGYSELGEAFAGFGLDFLASRGKGTTHGIEIFAEKRLSEIPLYGRVSMTLAEARFTALDGINRPSSSDQRFVMTLSGGYIFDELWEITSTFRYASGRPYTPYNFNEFVRSTEYYNTSRTKPNHNLDMRISRRWVNESWNCTAYLDIQNVYSKKWIEVPYWSERNNREETPQAFGIVPSIGIIAEF
jgi:hypothetical protein